MALPVHMPFLLTVDNKTMKIERSSSTTTLTFYYKIIERTMGFKGYRVSLDDVFC